jgi:hypothetical protein
MAKRDPLFACIWVCTFQEAPNVKHSAKLRALATLALSCALSSIARADAPPVYGYAFTPPAAAGSPRILSIELNSDSLHAGGPIDIRVKTTPDVTGVTTGHGKHKGALVATAPGVFTGDSVLPHVGGLLNVGIKLHFEATTADGKTISADVPVHYK